MYIAFYIYDPKISGLYDDEQTAYDDIKRRSKSTDIIVNKLTCKDNDYNYHMVGAIMGDRNYLRENYSDTITIYTDGSVSHDNLAVGYAGIILYKNYSEILACGIKENGDDVSIINVPSNVRIPNNIYIDSNFIELLAIDMSLSFLLQNLSKFKIHGDISVIIYTDSQYAIDKLSDNDAKVNDDYKPTLDHIKHNIELLNLEVLITHVRSKSCDPLNDLADLICWHYRKLVS